MDTHDIFSAEFIGQTEERAGSLLSRKDLLEDRHSKKKTDEDIYNDFLHNVSHPFMTVLRREAAKYAKEGTAFVVRNRVAVLIDDEDSEDRLLYYNDGDAWRQSGEALIGKYLKEIYPELHMPGMKFGCKGEKLMLDAYPDRFNWVREVYKERSEKKEGN